MAVPTWLVLSVFYKPQTYMFSLLCKIVILHLQVNCFFLSDSIMKGRAIELILLDLKT